MLRDVAESDLERFFEHQREPEANRLARFAPRARDAFMEHWKKRVLGDPHARTKTIVVDDEVVGNVVSWEHEGRRLLGYWIGQAHWGRGIATLAVAEFVRAYEKTRPLYAHVAVDNAPSLRVLEKCGFRRCGDPMVGADSVAEWVMCLADEG